MRESESDGTIKYFSLAFPIIDALENGKRLIVDEFGAKLHTLLIERIVSMFNSEKANKSKVKDSRVKELSSFIYVYVTAKELVLSASCICNVGDIETELSGLENDEYKLIYNYKSSTEDITQEVMFEYSSLLNKKVDFERTMYLLKTTLP